MTKGAGQMNNDATMKEKADVLRNDLRNQGTTLSRFAESEAATSLGRFAAISAPTVVGSSQIPQYPAAFLQHDPVPTENPLGYSVNEMDTTGERHELRASCLEPNFPPSAQSPDPSAVSPDRVLPSPSSQVSPLAGEGLGFSQRTYRRF
jgi:hypothetical protein